MTDPLRTARLTLPLVTPAQAADLRAGVRHPNFAPGFPRTDDIDAASTARAGDPWGPRLVVRSNDGLVCGTIGCFAPPEEVEGVLEVEVGYGLARDALAALIALADRAGVRMRASVAPDHAAGLRVLAKAGFTQLRATTDDGDLVMVRPLPETP